MMKLLFPATLVTSRPHFSRHFHTAPHPIGEIDDTLLTDQVIRSLPVVRDPKHETIHTQRIPLPFKQSPQAALFPSSFAETEAAPAMHSLRGVAPLADARHDAEAEASAELSSTVDFAGNCHNFVPMAGLSSTRSLDDCWDACRNFQFCTQVHYVRGNCFVAQGISQSFGVRAASDGTCRSLTDLGMLSFLKMRKSSDLALPSFTQLPSEQKFTLVQPRLEASKLRVTTASFFQCQSGCFDKSWCRVAVWLDTVVSGQAEKICMFGSSVILNEADSLEKCSTNLCMQNVCGDQTCLVAEKNPADFGSVKTAINIEAESVPVEDKVCECLNEMCSTNCRREAEISCIRRCSEKEGCKVAAVQKSFGKFSCYLSYATPVSQNKQSTEFSFFARPEIRTISSSINFVQIQRGEALGDNLQVYPNGACDIFHAGLTVPNAPAFSAKSASECWSLCQSYAPYCLQSEFTPGLGGGVCTLGDALATNYIGSVSGTQCYSLSASFDLRNGLPGMIVVDTVTGQSDSALWFTDSQAATSVSSLEECQAKLKNSVLPGASYGGYATCVGIRSVCSANGNAHPDCPLCSSGTVVGVCRIGGAPAATAVQILGGPGAVKFFEQSLQGFELTNGISQIDISSQICNLNSASLKVQNDTTGCHFRVDSLKTCQTTCQSSSGCIAGLYTDDQTGAKSCYLAKALNPASPSPQCTGNCASFQLAGIGVPLPLTATGTSLADQVRGNITEGVIFNYGKCLTMKVVGKSFSNPPSQFAVSPHADCFQACQKEPLCRSFQLQGYQSGGNCSLSDTTWSSTCDIISCVLSSAITAVPEVTPQDESYMCFSYTAKTAGLVREAEPNGLNLGIPGYSLFNNGIRKFTWATVTNSANLLLTQSLEDCQSACKSQGENACAIGSWQLCTGIKDFCQNPDGSVTAAALSSNSELSVTCLKCAAVNNGKSQPLLPFPANWGVCKLSSQVTMTSQQCVPGPCFSFEGGNDRFEILSEANSPFLDNNGNIIGTLLVRPGYFLDFSLKNCQDRCLNTTGCQYGHYEPATHGYGSCYLSGNQLRAWQNGKYLMTNAHACTSRTCVVFATTASAQSAPPSN